MMAYPRKYPCCDCNAPNTAMRAGTRCPDCAIENARRTRAAYEAKHRPALFPRRKKPAPVVNPERPMCELYAAGVVCLPQQNPLRQELGLSMGRRAARDKAAVENAREIMALYDAASKPKRGRPKQSIGRAENARERAA